MILSNLNLIFFLHKQYFNFNHYMCMFLRIKQQICKQAKLTFKYQTTTTKKYNLNFNLLQTYIRQNMFVKSNT